MTNTFVKSVLGGAALAVVAMLTATTGAQAQVRCLSDGYRWHCEDGYFGAVPGPTRGYQPGWRGNNYGGDYDQTPNDYPGPVYDDRY